MWPETLTPKLSPFCSPLKLPCSVFMKMEKAFTLVQTIATATVFSAVSGWYGFMFGRESARKELGSLIEDLPEFIGCLGEVDGIKGAVRKSLPLLNLGKTICLEARPKQLPGPSLAVFRSSYTMIDSGMCLPVEFRY